MHTVCNYIDIYANCALSCISDGGTAAEKRWEELQLSERHKSEVEHSRN